MRPRLLSVAPLAARALAVLVLVLPQAGFAQTAGGSIEGRVIEEGEAPLPGATVTATSTATGLSRASVTGEDGRFSLFNLPVGDYDVRVELDGYATVIQEGVTVNVARTRSLEISLGRTEVAEEITVVDEAPLIATSPSIGTVVSLEEIENLPINTRQFAALGTLAPGTQVAVNPDPTKVGKLVIALNGGSGRNVNFVVDGGDNTDDTIGGQLQNFSLESVAEFNIQTTPYKAEYGRTTGGVLTVVTKTGTNEISGSVFGFFRDDGLNEKTETESRAGADKQAFERLQYGFSLGGPFVADRTHYFLSAEQLTQDTSYIVASGGVFPELDGRDFPLATDDTLITAKVTHQLSPAQYLQFRYGYQKTEDTYGATPTVTPDSLGDLNNDFQTVLVGLNSTIGSNSFNELVLQYSDFENTIFPVSTNPTNYFPSGVVSGQNINSPQSTTQEKRQIKDNFSWSTDLGGRRHDFKGGIEYIDEPTLGGTFSSGTNGLLTRTLDDPNSPVTDITFLGGDFAFATPNEQWRVYVQDDWYLNERFTLSLGLRYEYTDILELDQRSNPIWQVLSTQTQFNEFYLQDFQGGAGGVLEADDNDLAPRLGFTWDVKGDGRQLLRGGWGVFYDFPYSNATVLFPTAAVLSDFGVVYNHNDPGGIRNADGTFWQPGDPLPPNQLSGTFILPPNEVASPTLATPEATQASLGYSIQVAPWIGLNFEVVSVDYDNLPFRFRANPIDPATGARRFPEFGNFRLWYGNGEAEYNAFNAGVRGRSGGKFEFQGFYTYSETDGNILAGADEFRLTANEHQPDLASGRDVSINPLDPLCGACFGPLNVEAKNRLTLAGLYQAPHGIVVSGLFRYRSALPYTVRHRDDLNGDGFVLDLAPGIPHVNSRRGSSFAQLDVRVAKEFALRDDLSIEVMLDIFNLLDDENPAAFTNVFDASGNPIGLVPTAFAGDPGQGEQRVAQLGVRLRF